MAEEKPNLCFMFGWRTTRSLLRRLSWLRRRLSVPPRTATTATSSRLWWTAERQATTSTTQPSPTSNTVCKTTCISFRSARFYCRGSSAGRYRRHAARPFSRQLRKLNPCSGRYRGGTRNWAQPRLGGDDSQKGYCDHLRLQTSQAY